MKHKSLIEMQELPPSESITFKQHLDFCEKIMKDFFTLPIREKSDIFNNIKHYSDIYSDIKERFEILDI